MTDRSKARWTLLLLLACLIGGGSTLIIFAPAVEIKEDVWANRDDEVVTILKSCNIPGTQITIMRRTGNYLGAAKTSGNFIEFEGWYAFQVYSNKPVYEAGVGYKANGIRRTAKWDVDLSQKTVRPRNQMAFIFSGNNDVLVY